jgi:hypothetical protein
MFRVARWHKFFIKFQGLNDQVMLQFSRGFNRCVAQIGELVMEVSENTISYATSLLREGEKWFKNCPVGKDLCNWFLKPEFQDENWAKEIPQAWIKDEWHAPLVILYKYLTCEGCYALTF